MPTSDSQSENPEDSAHSTTPSGQIRYLRSVGLARAVALGSSVTVGVGVYLVLGELFHFADSTTVTLGYLLAAAAALPVILTLGERVAYLPIRGGLYGISREASLLSIPYFTGWLMFGGLTCLTALLGWGIAVYARILLTIFLEQQLPQIPWLGAVVTAAGVGLALLWKQWNWQRYTILILAAIAFLALLIVRGFFALDANVTVPRMSTVDLIDVIVTISASFWGIHFVLDARNQMHRPTRNLPRALLINGGLRTLLGIAAAIVMQWYPDDTLATNTTLRDLTGLPLIGLGPLWQLSYGLFGLIICLFAFRQAVTHAAGLVRALRRDGYLPGSSVLPGLLSNVDPVHLAFWVLAVSAAAVLSSRLLIELSASGFLLSTALALVPALRSSNDSPPPNRRLKLPFHPLFPALTVAIGVLLTVLTVNVADMIWLAWAALGIASFFLGARARAADTRRESTVVEDESGPPYHDEDLPTAFRVLVVVDKPEDVEKLVRAACLLTQKSHDEVIVLKVLSVPNYVSESVERKTAQEELEKLQELVEPALSGDCLTEGVEISPMVRLTSTPTSGILDTATEEEVSLLLVSWRGQVHEERRTPNSLLNDLVRYAPCPVTILRGELPEKIEQMVVFCGGGPNATASLPLAERLADACESSIELVTVNSNMKENEAQEILSTILSNVTDPDRYEISVVDAGSVEAGVSTASEQTDLALLGFSKEEVSSHSYFGGLAALLAENSEKPIMLVRGEEHIRYVGAQRMLESLRDELPNLTNQERSEVAQKMREDAIPSVDFFVLITLAAAIATFGLLQASSAVIIGAMLVAPLMSPILATGMAIVMGETYTLRIAAEATAKGIALAVLVGIIATMLSPFTEPTPEILSRTAPTVLDLLVALASGAAAGYAVCRKEVAAALPGVAISAALVPPLCVVGYGISTSQFDVATGSLLLFATNLVAIIVASAIVFLALGFHPPRSERDELRRNLWVSGISLGAVFVILLIATIVTLREANTRVAVEEVLRQDLGSGAIMLDRVEVDRRGGTYFVQATVFAFDEELLSSAEIERLQTDLTQAIGGPAKVDLTVVPASGTDLAGAAGLRALDEYFRSAASEVDISVAELQTKQEDSGILLRATIVTYAESTMSQATLASWQSEMSVMAGQPVVLEVTVIQGQRDVIEPIGTPSSAVDATATPTQ